MYQPEYKNDLRSIIRYTINEVLETYRNYNGCKVKEVLDDGIVLCYIPTLSDEDNKDTWITCKNGTRYYSNIIPNVDDYLVVQIQTGNPSIAYYISFDPSYYQVLNKNYDKVLFEYKDSLIYYDSNNLIIENDNCKITLEESEIKIDTKGFFNNTNIVIKDNETSIKTKLLKIDGDVEISGDVDITGDTTIDGTLDATDDITSDTEVIAGVTKVKLTLHKHTTVLGPTIPPVIPE